MPRDLSRRRALVTAAGVTAAAALGTTGVLSTPALAAPGPVSPSPVPSGAAPNSEELKEALRRLEARRRRVLTGRHSENGWEMQKVVDAEGDIVTHSVPGTGLTVTARSGDVGTVLVHVIRRFHYEVDALGLPGEPRALEGWTKPSEVRDSRLPESNRASGTAVVIRPGSYPAGARGGFDAAQLSVIRDILADTEGVVRWGGDDRRPQEGLFSLVVRPGDPRLAQVAAKLRDWDRTPGLGAGTVADVNEPARRRRAARFS
ncbi:hypothetical protein [Streptomyces tanashiensis]|uniref:hypothetical protein n=1 Tax=Streptomyces tanashiensis TaxID=67367 RepID=UPI00357139BD